MLTASIWINGFKTRAPKRVEELVLAAVRRQDPESRIQVPFGFKLYNVDYLIRWIENPQPSNLVEKKRRHGEDVIYFVSQFNDVFKCPINHHGIPVMQCISVLSVDPSDQQAVAFKQSILDREDA